MGFPAPKDLESVYLVRGDEMLGTLEVDHLDFPWVMCSFVPSPTFVEVKPFFDHELRLLNEESMDAWGAAYGEIVALGLQLVDASRGAALKVFLLHIEGTDAWFRY